ncbi:putative protein kinase RLK-Pelle-CrRLK1L-1 family [Helianthus annuus]|nr:putative protein kinase RLK-Pelle-CrRLK1L-1 family [Helianthus annuus]
MTWFFFPEFHSEITILSKIGYCEEQSEMILVYEYMEKGPLRNHLYGSNLPPLSWKQRLEICIRAARGLHYLHTGSAQGMIHRDIKFTNILLDESNLAKVADFGLSRSGPCLSETHVSTGFHSEITILSKIGYCEEQSEMILVYEYMEKGPLRNHLYGSNLPPLSWKHRLEICIRAARGLHYLHTGSAQGIIHRDIKSTNILLDESNLAKVADFGLSRSGPCLSETHVSTGVKGSFGYLDPEYFRRQQLTDKSDVNLGEWAIHWKRKGLLKKIVNPRISDQIKLASLKKYADMAEKCLVDYGVDRPTMGDVLWNIEYALQIQETESVDSARTGHTGAPEIVSGDGSSNVDGSLSGSKTNIVNGTSHSKQINCR